MQSPTACTVVFFMMRLLSIFFFNDTATPEISTLSLHDALPICPRALPMKRVFVPLPAPGAPPRRDRKSTRLNSSHLGISYAVFCLKKIRREYNLTGPRRSELEADPIAQCKRWFDQALFLQTSGRVRNLSFKLYKALLM